MPLVELIPISDNGPNDGQAVPSGPHRLNVDEDPAANDGLTTRVQFSTPGKEVFGWDVSGIGPADLIGVVDLRWAARRGGTPPWTARVGLRIGGTEHFSPTVTLDFSFPERIDSFAVDPSDGQPWTKARLSAAEPIFEMVTSTIGLPRGALTAIRGTAEVGPSRPSATGSHIGPAASGAGPGPAASAATGPEVRSTAAAAGPAGVGSVAATVAAQGSRTGPSSVGSGPGPRASGSRGARAKATPSAVSRPRATASRIGPVATGEALDKDRGEVS